MSDIHIGYEVMTPYENEEGEIVVDPTTEVVLEPSHFFIAGTTRTGKSQAMRRLIQQCKSKIVIIDAKRKRDYADFNADIPLYIEQQMEPIVIKDSIETTERFTIKQQFGTLLDTVAESETWEEMLEVIEREMKTQRSGYVKNNLKILRYFIKRLIKEYDKFQWSDKLELNDGISVLDISRMGIQMQQLVVGSVARYILNNLNDVTLVIDEAHRFIPQGQTTGCSRDIISLAREGLASKDALWVADQTMTGVSKNLLKQTQYWILGRQPELNEAEKTVKQIPRRKSLGITTEMIQTLRLGEFLVVCPDWAKKTYIWPLWVSEETAMKVAMGEMTAKAVSKLEKQKDGEDDMFKDKYLEEKKKAEEERKKRIEAEKSLKFALDEIEKHKRETKAFDKRIKELEKQQQQREIVHIEAHEKDEQFGSKDAKIPAHEFQATKTRLTTPNIEESDRSESEPVQVETWTPISHSQIVDIVDSRVSQLTLDEARIVVVELDDAIREKIVDDYLDLITKNLSKLKETAKVSARFIVKRKRLPFGDLMFHIRNRRGKPDSNFTRDYITPLTTSNIVEKKKVQNGYELVWLVDNQLQSHFQNVLNPDEIKKVIDFVHSLIL